MVRMKMCGALSAYFKLFALIGFETYDARKSDDGKI